LDYVEHGFPGHVHGARLLVAKANVVSLRLSKANLAALSQGVRSDSTFIRLAMGIDGVYELYLEGYGEAPLPDHNSEPLVPLEG